VDRRVGFDREQSSDGGALAVVELSAKARRGDDLLALVGRHLAEIQDGAGHEAAAVRGQCCEGLHGSAVLLNLGRGHVFQNFVALQGAVALRLGHAVEAAKLIEFALLNLRGELVETGLVLKRALLLWEGEILVVLHPLLEMPLGLFVPDGGIIVWRGTVLGLSGRTILSNGWRRGCGFLGTAGERRHSGGQHKKRRANTEPGWTMPLHNILGDTLNGAATVNRVPYRLNSCEFKRYWVWVLDSPGPTHPSEVYCQGPKSRSSF
jgi:hypothetical protein